VSCGDSSVKVNIQSDIPQIEIPKKSLVIVKKPEKFKQISLNRLIKKYKSKKPKRFSPWIWGTKRRIRTKNKIIALTFDACGGKGGSGYDNKLINYLRREKIPAFLFLSGRWIKRNRKVTEELARDPLFRIGNHGMYHRPASITGKKIYKRTGTYNITELYYEIYSSARMIHKITGKVPRLYRPGTAFIDDVAMKIVRDMKFKVVSYSVNPGDAELKLPLNVMIGRFFIKTHPGAIVILHMNKPKGKTLKILQVVVPSLQKMGYKFVQLDNYKNKLK